MFTEGSDAVLICRASGTGTPIDSIVWSVDGTPVNELLEHIDINVVGVGQSELEFSPIQFSDVGTYKCEASNGVGQDSAEVTITVNGEPRSQYIEGFTTGSGYSWPVPLTYKLITCACFGCSIELSKLCLYL